MSEPAEQATPGAVERQAATAREVKALAHPLRLRILRLCRLHELTNKQLADQLDQDPGTVLYHVKQLLNTGFLLQAPVRTGESGALEKPYRSTGRSWALDTALADDGGWPPAPLEAFQEELREAGPSSIETMSRFVLHLSPKDSEEFASRIQEVLDAYVQTDDSRLDHPAHGGVFVVHRVAE